MSRADDKPKPRASSEAERRARFEAVCRLLADPATYADRTRSVERIETHISVVFVGDRLVYKLKKPVRFEFVDFSTLAARRAACEEELRLNRRLATDVYLRVVPIAAGEDGSLILDGKGEPVEWVVEMRRLPTERSLAARIAAREVRVEDVDAVARLLGDFYASAEGVDLDAVEYRREVEHHVRANLAELSQSAASELADLVRRPHGAQLRMLLLRGELFGQRVAARRIVDGHGDLRAEHVILGEPPVVFDCLEFDAWLRQLDVADELCFLAVECERLGASWVGNEILKKCLARIGDRAPAELSDFYKSYRACVRAKVAALRGRQLTGEAQADTREEMASYLRQADAHARRWGGTMLLVFSGMMGSGKSTLATAVGERLSLPVLPTDAVRRELFPESASPVDYNAAHYSAENRARVYGELFRRAEAILATSECVVLDGTFLSSASVAEAAKVAESCEARLLVVRCECDEATARQRIAARLSRGGDLSEARPEWYARQREEMEPIAGGIAHVRVDTTLVISRQVEGVLAAWRALTQ